MTRLQETLQKQAIDVDLQAQRAKPLKQRLERSWATKHSGTQGCSNSISPLGVENVCTCLGPKGNNVHNVKVMCFVLFCAPGVTLEYWAIRWQLAGRLQETVDLLHNEYKVISYEYET